MSAHKSNTFRIPSPCDTALDNLERTSRGWHCRACQETVFDSRVMTAREFEAEYEARKGKMCMVLCRDEEGTIVHATPDESRWFRQLEGLGKLIATAAIPPLLLAGCLESQPSPALAEANAPTSIEQTLQAQEEAAASRLAEFHIKQQDQQKKPEHQPLRLEVALSNLNKTQSQRNERHDHPTHPSDEAIEHPLAPGEKMEIDMEASDVTRDLEAIQLTREERSRRKRLGGSTRNATIIFGSGNR